MDVWHCGQSFQVFFGLNTKATKVVDGIYLRTRDGAKILDEFVEDIGIHSFDEMINDDDKRLYSHNASKMILKIPCGAVPHSQCTLHKF